MVPSLYLYDLGFDELTVLDSSQDTTAVTTLL